MKKLFIKKTELPVSPQSLFDWHMREGAFERLTPPWEHVRMQCADPEIKNGSRVSLEIDAGPAKINWLAEHCNVEPGESFTDIQVRGPFKYWKHEHIFEKSQAGCVLTDSIQYELPFDFATIGSEFVIREKLKRMFEYRHAVTKNDISLLNEHAKNKVMKILVTGASGLVGSSLLPFLKTQGHKVQRLARHKSARHGDLIWDPEKDQIPLDKLEGFDAIIHLAGDNIADGAWTNAKKQKLVDSRIKSTRLLTESLTKLKNPPSVFVCASATGYYGDRGDEILSEESKAGQGFLAALCADWECEAARVTQNNIRAVMLRIGLVLTPGGGMLPKILPPFLMGGGGPIGSGKQYISWIAMDDLVSIIFHAVSNENLRGPVNAVAPDACTNSEFSKVLGKVLRRPAILPVPDIALKLSFGEMAKETMLSSCRAEPKALLSNGFDFLYPSLEQALRHLLGKTQG